jgi:hypothetical protein
MSLRTLSFVGLLAVLTSCSVFEEAKHPSPEQALEAVQQACVVADLTPKVPSELREACDLIQRVEISEAK